MKPIRQLGRTTLKGIAKVLAILEYSRIYRFPDGLSLFNRVPAAMNLLISNYTDIIANRYIRERGTRKRIVDRDSALWSDPYLKCQAMWSIGNGSINTPCPVMLAKDLASVTSLKGKRILCIGAKNHFEINLLVRHGATRTLISAIDLYSNIPGIIPMDFHKLEFSDASFDIVFWAGSFAYARDFQQAANEGIRVLRRPGILALGDSLKGGATREMLLERQPEIQDALEDVPADIGLFTQPLHTIDRASAYFTGVDRDAKVVLTRQYPPNHANIIFSYH